MTRVLVLYYSAFGYVTVLAHAIAEGARAAGAEADIRRVPDLAPPAAAKGRIFDAADGVPVAAVADLAAYDAIVVGSPTRFGRLSSPIAGFLEQATELAGRGVLKGKVGGAFTSPTGAHGGQESAAVSIIMNLLHFGMVIAGPPFSATTVADDTGQRYPGELDLEQARQQGELIARTAQRLSGQEVAPVIVPAPASAGEVARGN